MAFTATFWNIQATGRERIGAANLVNFAKRISAGEAANPPWNDLVSAMP